MQCLTIDEIIAIEPRVGELLRAAKADARREDVAYLYGWYKPRLGLLVGWYSPHEELKGQDQYKTVMDALCEALDY